MDGHDLPNQPDEDDRQWAVLDRFLAGESTPEEARAVRTWLAADPVHKEWLESARQIRELASSRPPALSTDEAWRQAAVALGLGTDSAADGHHPAFPERSPFRLTTGLSTGSGPGGEGQVLARVGPVLQSTEPWRRTTAALRIAATVALIAGAGLFWWSRSWIRPEPPAAPISFSEYRAAVGERATFHLSDGTEVRLAPGSVLRRPSNYGVGGRQVYLEGEAYFVVTHDSTRQFSVETAHAVARDLGTRFVVRAYRGDAATNVVVAEGSVAVSRVPTRSGGAGLRTRGMPSDNLVLTQRQRATVASSGIMTLTPRVSLDRYLGWTEGRLVFEKTSLREVVTQLERWYGIDIRLADSRLGDLQLTATIENEPAADAVALVATSLELSLSRSQGIYLLSHTRS